MFTTLLEGLVPNLETVNLGVSGYSTDQELLLYQNEGYKYQADMIVILVVENDLLGITESTVYLTYPKPVFRLENDNLVLHNYPVQQTPKLIQYAAKLASGLYLMKGLNGLREQFGRGNTHPGEKSSSKELTNPVGDRKDGDKLSFPDKPVERLMIEELHELRRTIIEKQPEAKIVIAFNKDILSFRKICSHLRGEGISCLLLGQYFDGTDEAIHLPGDLHWNARGHELVAKVLAEAIKHEFARVETRPGQDDRP
ncbi:MAG: hypothetical protein L0H94_08785 [Nitrospira sp.]|nr:hypothetical protein [Nitrospira sp.]